MQQTQTRREQTSVDHAQKRTRARTEGAISFHGTIDEKFIRGGRGINCACETNTDNFSEMDAGWKRGWLYGVTVIRIKSVRHPLWSQGRGGRGDKKWEGGIRKESITRNI